MIIFFQLNFPKCPNVEINSNEKYYTTFGIFLSTWTVRHCAGSLRNHNKENGGSLQVSDSETKSWPILTFMVIKSIAIEYVTAQQVGSVSREVNAILEK